MMYQKSFLFYILFLKYVKHEYNHRFKLPIKIYEQKISIFEHFAEIMIYLHFLPTFRDTYFKEHL